MSVMTSTSTSSTFNSTYTSFHSLLVPMPTPGTKHAPCFKGRRVEDFLDALENHADNAQLPHSALLKWVPRYCSDRVRQLSRRHAVWAGDNWAAACAFLVKLYASADRDSLITSDKLRAWVAKHAQEGIFEDSRDIDKYYPNVLHKLTICFLVSKSYSATSIYCSIKVFPTIFGRKFANGYHPSTRRPLTRQTST